MPAFLTPLVLRRLALSALLLADVLYAVYLAPKGNPPSSSQYGLFVTLALGQGPARNPAIWGVFQLLGIVPLLYWALLFPDGRGQRVWAWPFALGMMAFGAFSLLPYLILRRGYEVAVPGKKNLAVRWFGCRPFAIFAVAALTVLLGIVIIAGNGMDYLFWFRRSNFVNVMTVDLVVLTLLFPILLRDDMARRSVSDDSTLGRIALGVPLLGPAYYLVRRPAEDA